MSDTAIAYGSISIVDITDIGEFSANMTSNLPLSVIYNPDQNSFTPNWGDSNLILTPVLYYAGTRLNNTASGVTITWQRQEGIGGIGNLVTGETVTDGVLTVSSNKFTSNSTMITYILTASYLEPDMNAVLTAQSQITFSLVKQASSVKSCFINGDTIFKYDTGQQLVGPSTITLTATLNNVSVDNWQYQNSLGNFINIENATTNTLVVNESDSTIFNDDKAVIKLKTNDNSVYDLHTIVKLRDGAAGSSTVSAVLTNDDQMIPFSSSGTGDFSSATSQIIIYEGGVDVTSGWTITVTYQSCTGTTSTTTSANDTVAVNSLSADTGNVIFKCEKSGYTTIYKTFSLVKVQSGADGLSPTIYSVEASSYALNKNINNIFNPTTVTFNAFSQYEATKSPYSGRFAIYENITMEEYDAASTKPTAKYSSTTDQSSYTFTPSTSATSILCVLYKSGSSPTGTTNRLDSQLVVITSDGQTGQQGQQGPAGVSAINVVLGNEADVIPCNTNNATQTDMTITIPFSGYKGTTKVRATVATPSSLFGTISPVVVNATSSSDGSITYTVPNGTNVPNVTGTISLMFTCEGQTINMVYRWTRSSAAANGENAIVLQLSTPKGNIFNNGNGSLDIQATLIKGPNDVTSSASYQWAKYSGSGYTNLTDEAGQISGSQTYKLTVYGVTVNSYASYRCTVTYDGRSYVQYYSLFDKSDPLQAIVLCSIGTQIVNGQGNGAFYCKVTRNGQEIDPIYSERFLVSDPVGTAVIGDYYYKLDTVNKTVKLMKYNGSAWRESSDSYIGSYIWSYRDKDGKYIENPTISTSGKVIYIDGSMIDKKIVADVEVTI